MERENRRLLGELRKECAQREEAETIIAGLRTQINETKYRLTEAEVNATCLSRKLDSLNDQSDELADCRAELALKEETIAEYVLLF